MQALIAGPIILLGMHKSGTTLVAETLHRSGIQMVGDVAEGRYDDGNKMERAETRELNMELLRDDGGHSFRVIRPPASISEVHRVRAQAMIETLAQAGPWGFKDPRTLLTFDFWEEMLEAPRLIGVFRDPVEVFGHYLKRAGRRWISRDPAYLPDALRAWCIYNRRLLEVKHRHPEMLLLDYADFMTTDAGKNSLASLLGRDLVDCRRPGMRRAGATPTADYRLARLIVRLRDRLDPDRIQAQLQEVATR
jgi:hypothetical protein